MAHYTINEQLPLSRILRDGMNTLRNGIYKLNWVNGALSQMTDQEVADALGLANATIGANAKAELSSDVGKLETDASQTGVQSAINQMLNQFA